MPNITQNLAEEIVRKLNRERPKSPKFKPFAVKMEPGRKHDVCKVFYDGKFIGQFGIQRGSKKVCLHNYVAEQLHLNRNEGYNLAKCPLSVDGYILLLQQRGHISADDETAG